MKRTEKELNRTKSLIKMSLLVFLFLFTVALKAQKEASLKPLQVSKCAYSCVKEMSHVNNAATNEEQSSLHILKFFGYHLVSDDAADKTNDEDYLLFEKKNVPGQLIAAKGDETAEKLLRILQSRSHDKHSPFNCRNAQAIHFQQPVIHSQIVTSNCQVILSRKYYSLLVHKS